MLSLCHVRYCLWRTRHATTTTVLSDVGTAMAGLRPDPRRAEPPPAELPTRRGPGGAGGAPAGESEGSATVESEESEVGRVQQPQPERP
eukprot:3642304-Rhodomonas_salina.5